MNVATIVCATGSGGTQAGLTLGAALNQNRVGVYGINVCDNAAWFIDKITTDIKDWGKLNPSIFSQLQYQPAINVMEGYVGEGYGRASQDVFNTINKVGALEGIIFDPVYTGKAFDGLLKEMAKGKFANEENVVFIHTGGVYGLFPYASALTSNVHSVF